MKREERTKETRSASGSHSYIMREERILLARIESERDDGPRDLSPDPQGFRHQALVDPGEENPFSHRLGLCSVADKDAAFRDYCFTKLQTGDNLNVAALLYSCCHIPSREVISALRHPHAGFVSLANYCSCRHGKRLGSSVRDHSETGEHFGLEASPAVFYYAAQSRPVRSWID